MPAPLPTAPAWAQTGEVEPLLDRSRALALFRSAGLAVDSADVVYLRLKPGESAMVGFLFGGRDEQGCPFVLPGYVRTFADGRAGAVVRKWERKRVHPTALGDGVRALPGGRSVLCLFPNDGRLGALPQVAPMGKLKRILRALPGITGDGARILARESRVQTVRYKPERRWIAAGDLRLRPEAGRRRRRRVFLRLFPDGRGQRIERVVGSLRAAGLGGRVPRPLGCAAGGRLQVEEAVAGEELLGPIYAGRAPAEQVA
ncbi:MAG: hypothetical protein ACE5JG_07450, partial [Planctomycetota bacterium]